MITIDTNAPRSVRRLVAIVILGAVALSVAALATVGAQPNDTGGGFLAWLGEYLSQVSEALGGG